MLKSFRYLLLPFSFLYSGILWIRNWLFDKDYIKSATFNLPIICVGNLAVGGTGKTPMVETLIKILQNDFTIATLSRGYGRMTKGFGIADASTTALEIGDEPMQFHQKFPKITVSVGEERLVAIPQLLHEKPDTEVIILDDAFQHRPVRAGLNILLTDYNNLYTRDFVLPGGDLRDIKPSAKRAQIIIVTKCDHKMSAEERNLLIRELKPLPTQSVFFTEIIYAKPYHLFDNELYIDITNDTDILLVCGIANPKAIKEFLTEKVRTYDMLRYADHHIYTSEDLSEIKKQFNKIKSKKKIIITTEKDAVRLQKFENDLKEYPVYVIPIQHSFMFNESDKFYDQVEGFIRSYPRNDLK